MNRASQWLTAGMLLATRAFADSGEQPFLLVRSDESYAYLADPDRRQDWDDRIKYLPLPGGMYLSVGGEIRERFDVFDAPRFGIASRSDSYQLQRLLLHGDVQLNSRLRLFAEVGRHDVFGKRTAILPVDRDGLDIQNLFIDVVPDPTENLRIRVGRQELVLNATQRFIGAREGPNVRQSYDGVRVSWKLAGVNVDLFSLRPVLPKPGSFDDHGDPNARFSGLNVSRELQPGGPVLEVYGLTLDRFGAQYGTEVSDERRRALGARLAQRGQRWDFDAEAMYQYGTFGHEQIRAWASGLDGGYTWQQRWRPRLGLRLDGASGGAPSDSGAVQTFNPLFPKGLYFDESQLTTYANLLSVRPSLTLKPFPDVSVQLSEGWRWRQNVHDELYLIPFAPVPQTLASTSRYVGAWSILDVAWRPDRYWTLQGEYVQVAAGPAVRAAGGQSVNFSMLIAQFRF